MPRNTRSHAKHSKTDVDDVDVQKVDVGGFVEPELLLKLVTDHSSDLSSLKGKDCQMAMLMMQQVIMKHLSDLVERNNELVKRVDESEKMVIGLEAEIVHKNVTIAKLESKVGDLDQYNRRNTMILTGLPVVADEVLETRIVDVLNKLNVLPSVLTTSDIGSVYRNRARSDSRPPSITVQFVRGLVKDRLFYNKKNFRLNSNKKLNIFHSMSPALLKEMGEIRSQGGDMVEYLDFRGHSQMFVVKVDGIDKLVKGVRSFRDLESKVGNLRKLKTQINETEKSNQSDAPSNIDQNPATFNVHPRRTTTSSTLPPFPSEFHTALSLNAHPGALNTSPSNLNAPPCALNAPPCALNVPPLKGYQIMHDLCSEFLQQYQ